MMQTCGGCFTPGIRRWSAFPVPSIAAAIGPAGNAAPVGKLRPDCVLNQLKRQRPRMRRP